MFKTGDILTKENYTAGAIWCNENGAMIEQAGDAYVITECPEPVVDAAAKRAERDAMLASYIWRVQRYDQQNSLQISTTDSAETYKNLLLYIQSLRDLTKDENFPNVTVLSFEDWITDKQETIDDIFS